MPTRVINHYEHKDKERVNNPPVGLATPETDKEIGKKKYGYDPHIDPALQFDSQASEIERLIDTGLAAESLEEAKTVIAELKKKRQPYLNWAGKAERTTFEVPTVSLHVHERIEPRTIIEAIRKRNGDGRQQLSFFDQPEENPPLREAIEFYRHKHGWSNRLIAGDSLLVMNSLLEKEGMAGQVQMIYVDPPYGIKYGSNFQPFVNKRVVRDGKDEDLTQEPETLKAFRDTWELGIHSYLTYLRDRLLLCRELLHESGSIFVQINDENLHHVRELMDEVFGAGNFVSLISFATSTGSSTKALPRTTDYLIWYARNSSSVKFRPLYGDQDEYFSPDGFDELGEYELASMTSQDPSETRSGTVLFQGQPFAPSAGRHWSFDPQHFHRLVAADRVVKVSEKQIRWKKYRNERVRGRLTNRWNDTQFTGFASNKVYVVQTGTKVIERCLLMTTDPGDLVFDPTCGSGTTAYCAEKWGRRWITCDTSRVAIAIARQRLLTAVFDYYELARPEEGVSGGFTYKTVPHITLESIAKNEEIDVIAAKYQPKIDETLAALNQALGKAWQEWEVPRLVPDPVWSSSAQEAYWKLREQIKQEDLLCGSLFDAESEINLLLNTFCHETGHRWTMDTLPAPIPADDWPPAARDALFRFWELKRKKRQEIDESIRRNAFQETLYDQPYVDKKKVRVTGPFTTEAVPAPVTRTVDEIIEEEKPAPPADTSLARSGETLRQAEWRDELLKTGIRGKGGQKIEFCRVEPLAGTRWLHADAETKDGQRAVVSFGPEHAPLERRQVELALVEAQKLVPRPKLVVFAAFHFDPEAAKDIDETNWPGVTLLKAQMNADLLTEDLKKKRASNESFWLIGQPDVALRHLQDGKLQVEVHGFDYYNPVTGLIESGGPKKIAMWMLDTDYDGRSLFPRQVFLPMADDDEGWTRLAKTLKAEIDDQLAEAYRGTVSLPFEPGPHARVAVKIIDDRGIESMKILEVQ